MKTRNVGLKISCHSQTCSVSEAVRDDALSQLEEHNARSAALREHLAEGETQARRSEFVENYSLQGLLAEMDRE